MCTAQCITKPTGYILSENPHPTVTAVKSLLGYKPLKSPVILAEMPCILPTSIAHSLKVIPLSSDPPRNATFSGRSKPKVVAKQILYFHILLIYFGRGKKITR